MSLQIQKHIKKVSLALVIFTIFFSFDVSFLEGRSCVEAYAACMGDAVDFLIIPNMFLAYTIYCTIGYGFCKKYIE